MVLPVIIVPDLATTARIRGNWRWERYGQIDQASYEFAAAIDEPELADVAVRAASRAMGRELRFSEARAVRLSPGDYTLAHHDRIYDDYPVEVTFDLSEREVPGADVHYRRRGNVFFIFPSQPRAAAIVERGPTVTCNHTYVSKLHTDAVTRAILLLY